MKNLREFAIETNKDQTAFLPGDVIRGDLYASFEEPVDIKSMTIFLCGEGEGPWLDQSDPSNEKENSEEDGKTKRLLIDVGLLVFGYSEDNNKKTDKHERGRYVYNFEFNIPKNLPCSFKSPTEKDLGYAIYYLKAVISRPRKYDKIAKLTIIINELVEPDRPDLVYTPGSYNEKSVSSGCMPSGTLCLEGYLNEPYYSQGENILINAVGENGSSKIIKEMYAKLVRRVRCKTRYGTSTYTADAANIHGARIPAQDR